MNTCNGLQQGPNKIDVRAKTIQQLAQQLSRLERVNSTTRRQPLAGRAPPSSKDWASTDRASTDRASTDRASTETLSTGIEPLDAILPGRGFSRGTLVEWLSAGDGSGAGALLFQVAARVMRSNCEGSDGNLASSRKQGCGNLVVIDPWNEFYPPAADRLGIEMQRVLVVHPNNERDTFWALEQSLRCRGVVVVGCLAHINDRVFRRLQLAAERGGGLGLLLRAARFRSQPSWASTRLHVTPLGVHGPSARSPQIRSTEVSDRGRRLQVELLRSNRGGSCCLELERNDETGAVHLVTELATTTAARRATGA